MKQINLIEIDLSKIDDCDHPDINEYSYYVIKYEGSYFLGKFEREWYGLNFDGVYDAGVQLDYSGLEAVYEVPNIEDIL